LADMATHYVGDNPDRVVLGKFDGHEGGYIGEARGDGGIYYDTGALAWDAVGQGLGPADADALGWQVNEQFLRTHMENGVSRIEYVLNSEYPSLEAVLVKSPDSFSAKEIQFLVENGPAYGYRRVGNAWVRD
ncbi:MAG TPA: endonuclease, partial [Mycobacterium sp.]